MTKVLTPVMVEEAVQAGRQAAIAAVEEYSKNHADTYACGFAWVHVYIDGRTPAARALKRCGFEKSWQKGAYVLWNPGDYRGQSVNGKEEGAAAMARVLRDAGLSAYSQSRLD